tara:strand:- start:5142 stop:6242 length:1101 start_codon:yes stop_codon:yes gene_type:complete
MRKNYFNRKGMLYLRIGAPIKTLSTGVRIHDASVKRNQVIGSDYSVIEANNIIKKLDKCNSIEEVKAVLKGDSAAYLTDLWEEVATSSIDIQARQLWINIIGGDSDIDLNVLKGGNNPDFIAEVRRKIAHYKGELVLTYKTSTASAYLNALKRVLKAVEETYGVRMPLSSCKSKQADLEPVILPYEVIEKILQASLFGNPYAVLMALQIEGCMRWDDLKKINADSFEESGGNKYIVTIGKNSQLCRRMIREDLWLKARDLQETKLLPNKDYDRYSVEIKSIVGKQLISVKREIGYGRYTHKQEPLSSVTTSHVLRKSGINLWRSRGLDDATIRNRLSYHKSQQVFEKHYLKTTDEILNSKISKLAI